jgi:hypothetical protein
LGSDTESPLARGLHHRQYHLGQGSFLPPPIGDSFLDIEKQKQQLDLSGPDVQIRFEFNVRGLFYLVFSINH